MAEEAGKELWRWTEARWTNPDIDPKKGKIISAGVDVGSVSTQAVLMVDGELYAFGNRRTGSNSPDSANNSMNWALEGTGLTLEDITYCIGTGYGRVNVPMAQRSLTEIACHARGANWVYGNTVRTVLDMGGQDCKIIRCDDKGKVSTFLMNDKCAAGTGRGMEVFSAFIGVHVEEIGDRSFDVPEEPQPVSSTCVIFAKSEATALLEEGWPINKVIAAYCAAMSHRVVGLIERLGPVEPEFCITGGISKNKGVVDRIEAELGVKGLTTKRCDPQLAGAIGAALFAQAMAEKQKK
ncbi:benzoyl-CoA reductase, bzd-type, subunit Q [Chloroflexota bacterium]